MKLGYVLSCTTGSRCVGVRNDPRVDRLGCGSILGRAEGGRESRVHWVCSSNAVSESGKDRKWEGVIALLRRDANGFGYFGPALDLCIHELLKHRPGTPLRLASRNEEFLLDVLCREHF